jgi:hypothetical protein
MDWRFVVFWDAELVLSWTSMNQLGYMFGSFRIGFLHRDEQQLNQSERAIVESMFGPVIYRAADAHAAVTTVAIAWLPAASYPACQPDSQLERKRTFFWQNKARNRSIAAAAQALVSGNSRAASESGLENACQWLSGRGPERASISGSATTVAVVVENLEHARELAPLLPGWLVASLNDGRDPLISGNAIVTLPLAAKSTLATDAVIFVAGTGTAWFDELGVACSGITGERMLVIDVADDCDRQAVEDADLRRADYHRRGWTTAMQHAAQGRVL